MPIEYPDLAPDHPRHEDGHPYDEYFGQHYHIVFSSSLNGQTGEDAPSYEIHDGEHHCVGHIHDYGHARFVAMTLALSNHDSDMGRTIRSVFTEATKPRGAQ